jgi:hypothetical protein
MALVAAMTDVGGIKAETGFSYLCCSEQLSTGLYTELRNAHTYAVSSSGLEHE